MALTCLALAVWSFLDDRSARTPVREAATRFTMDVRRPAEMEMIGYAPSADFASQVLAASAIGDALGRTRLAGLSPAERRAWLDVPLDLDDELATAIDLQLRAIRRNPGWPLHRYYLGKLAYARERRSLGTPVEPDRWFVPLESAWRNAPGHELTVETLGGVVLEGWRVLSEERRSIAGEVFKSAMIDPTFVARTFPDAVMTLGSEIAFGSLPDEPAPLFAAARALGRLGDIREAARLYERWESAEWRARELDLATMRNEHASGDLRGLLAAAAVWSSRHHVRAFDTDVARHQAEEVLRLWPKDRVGSWGSDPRSEIVRYLLDGRLESIDPSVLEDTVSVLSNTPSPVRARIALAAGKPDKAESILSGAGSEGAFEWTDYLVDLATRAIARNNLDAAIAAIGRISPSARGECDVVVVRRMAGEELPPPSVAIEGNDGAIVTEAWSTNGMLGFCVDPATHSSMTLTVDFQSASPVLLEWGLNGGRRDTVLVDETARIELPFTGLSGRNVLYTKVLWGEGPLRRVARVK